MFFKPQAHRLIEALDATCKGPSVTPEDFRRYKDLDEKIRRWGARHPEEFMPILSEERANSIGIWIRGSGEKGISLLRNLIRDPGAPQRRAALRALWEFEEAAESEISLLADLLEDPDAKLRQSAAHCLGRIGPRAVGTGPKLADLAQYGDDDERVSAFFALERTGYDAMITAQICYDAVRSGAVAVRDAALSTLRAIEADPAPVMDSILRKLNESDGHSLESATIDLLLKIDLSDEPRRRRAIEALESFVVKQLPNRTRALTALWSIDPGNPIVFAQIENDLRSNDWQMESACDVICQMNEAGARFVPLLIQQVRRHWEYWDFCWAAVDALGEIGGTAEAATSILEKLQTHPSDLVQKRAGLALKKIRG